jgi:hypothetical protein
MKLNFQLQDLTVSNDKLLKNLKITQFNLALNFWIIKLRFIKKNCSLKDYIFYQRNFHQFLFIK